jgi:hypothetical protein
MSYRDVMCPRNLGEKISVNLRTQRAEAEKMNDKNQQQTPADVLMSFSPYAPSVRHEWFASRF